MVVHERIPTIAIIPLRPIIYARVSYFVLPDPSSAMYSIPYRMQKLMPSTGKKRGIEAAYPFCQSGKSFSNP